MGWANLLPTYVLLLAGLCPCIYGNGTYVMNQCYCWNDMDSTLQDQLLKFTPTPSYGTYSYVGVQPTSNTSYKPCQCNDVTRSQTSVVISDEKLFLAATSNDPSLSFIQDTISQNFKLFFDSSNRTSFVRAVATLTQNVTSPNTTWTVEAITKGNDLNANTLIQSYFQNNITTINGVSHYSGIAGAISGTFNFTVLQCIGDPPNVSANGFRNWTNLRFPGVMATYSCANKYFISDVTLAYSQCTHQNITWSTPLINLTCQQGCQSVPPQSPYFSVRKWNSVMRKNGDYATYVCMDGYKSVDGTNGTSTCTSSSNSWSAIQSTFKCKQILCPLDIPQVPAFCKTDWDGATVYIGTPITYTCIDGYSATVFGTMKITCQKNGTWSTYPRKYQCINIQTAIRLGIFDGSSFAYDYYEDGIMKKEVPTANYFNLFSYITVPSVIAMALLILFCLCGTRTNSCLYWLCTGNTRNTAYIKV